MIIDGKVVGVVNHRSRYTVSILIDADTLVKDLPEILRRLPIAALENAPVSITFDDEAIDGFMRKVGAGG